MITVIEIENQHLYIAAEYLTMKAWLKTAYVSTLFHRNRCGVPNRSAKSVARHINDMVIVALFIAAPLHCSFVALERWHLKPPKSQLFIQKFDLATITENIKVLLIRPFVGESNDDRWNILKKDSIEERVCAPWCLHDLPIVINGIIWCSEVLLVSLCCEVHGWTAGLTTCKKHPRQTQV